MIHKSSSAISSLIHSLFFSKYDLLRFENSSRIFCCFSAIIARLADIEAYDEVSQFWLVSKTGYKVVALFEDILSVKYFTVKVSSSPRLVALKLEINVRISRDCMSRVSCGLVDPNCSHREMILRIGGIMY